MVSRLLIMGQTISTLKQLGDISRDVSAILAVIVAGLTIAKILIDLRHKIKNYE